MNERVKQILDVVSQLSESDRVALASALMDGLVPNDEAGAEDWRSEIASRFEAYSRGDTQIEDADAVIREARENLRR